MKKKILLGILIAVAVMCLFAISISAAEATIGGFKYTTKSDGTATLSSNESFTGTTAVIPETVEIDGTEYTVNQIGNSIFQNNTTIETISFPSTITTVGSRVITKCTALKAVYIDLDKLVSVGECALTYNSASQDTDMDETTANREIYFYATSEYGKDNPVKTEEVDFKNLTSMGYSAFQGLNVKKVTLYFTNRQIFRYANIEELVIKGNIETIEQYAFDCCFNLSKVTVESTTLKTVGSSAFSSCRAMTNIKIDLSGVTNISGSAFRFSGDRGTANNTAMWNDLDGQNIVDLSSLKTIGSQAFAGSNLGNARVVWPTNLEATNLGSTGDSSTFRNANITSVYIDTAEGYELQIDSWCFRNNPIETVIFGPGVTTLSNCFEGVKTIKTVVFLADNVDCTSSNLFKDCSGITFYHKGLTTNTTFSQATQINISEGSYTAYGACGVKVDLTPVEGEKVTLNYVDHDHKGVADQTVCPAGSLMIYTCTGCKDVYTEELEGYIGDTHVFDRANGATVADVVFANNNYFGVGVIVVECANCTAQANDSETVEPFFGEGGYSIPENGTTDCVSHTIKVNKSAIIKYQELTGKTVNYGTVAAVGSSIGTPLYFEEGESEMSIKAQALVSDMTNTNYTKLVIKITGIPSADTALNCNAYAVIGTSITYLCGEEALAEAKEVKLKMTTQA